MVEKKAPQTKLKNTNRALIFQPFTDVLHAEHFTRNLVRQINLCKNNYCLSMTKDKSGCKVLTIVCERPPPDVVQGWGMQLKNGVWMEWKQVMWDDGLEEGGKTFRSDQRFAGVWSFKAPSSPLCFHIVSCGVLGSKRMLTTPAWTPPGGSRLRYSLVQAGPTKTHTHTSSRDKRLQPETRCGPYLAQVRHFDVGLFGLTVLVQLQRNVGRVRRPCHVEDPQSHQAGDERCVVCRVQKQLPGFEVVGRIKQSVDS